MYIECYIHSFLAIGGEKMEILEGTYLSNTRGFGFVRVEGREVKKSNGWRYSKSTNIR